MLIDREMDKEDVVHLYNEILAIKKNEIMPFASTQMDLEIVILSEICHKETNKHPMISFIYRILKMI